MHETKAGDIQELLRELTHELRQPLEIICTSAYLLNLSHRGDSRIASHVSLVERQIERISELLATALEGAYRRPVQPSRAENFDLTKSATAGVT